MVKHITRSILFGVTALFFSLAAYASLFGNGTLNRFAKVDQAFAFTAIQKNDRVMLNWDILDGYYLYRHQISITPHQAEIGSYVLPEGKAYRDEFFGDINIFTGQLALTIPLLQVTGDNATLDITYQGCTEGFCYPPETRTIPLAAITVSDNAAPAAVSAVTTPADNANTATPLPFSPLWALLIGFGIAFTPCVLPMYPLISGIILGQKQRPPASRILLLSFVYVQGMALAYTLLGLAVAAAGMQFQAAFQHPYVLIGLAIIFTLLALSMFGLYTLQLPSSLQTRLAGLSNTQQGGSLVGVFVMGALAGLICSPCTTAPLSAILLYIAQSGNMLAGGSTLYLYALGMGLPLIVVTLFGNRLLPRSGPWMQYVKEGFGFIILALPIFLLERILGEVWGLRLWSALAVAFFSWAFILSLSAKNGWLRVLQVLLLAGVVICARPLQDWAFTPVGSVQTIDHLPFNQINDVSELELALKRDDGRITMLDLYADWCVACKEFEKYTFSDVKVRSALANVQLLQADVTANNKQQAELLKQLQVLGLPTILFYDRHGRELPEMRISGFMNADEFVQHLQKVEASQTATDIANRSQ